MPINPLTGVKTTITEFLDDLEKIVFTEPAERADLIFVRFFFEKMDSETLMRHVIGSVLPHKSQISVRDTKFFLERKKEIFGGLPADRVDYFASLIDNPEEAGGLSTENRDIVWSYFDILVLLAEKYKKNK